MCLSVEQQEYVSFINYKFQVLWQQKPMKCDMLSVTLFYILDTYNVNTIFTEKEILPLYVKLYIEIECCFKVSSDRTK